MGIIDLDEDEGGDDFDDLDDDKLPVLKNTYSKKNRPNNSKSMAVGSRSEREKAVRANGGTGKESSIVSISSPNKVEENKKGDIKEHGSEDKQEESKK